MTMAEAFLANPLARQIGLVLVHFLWEGLQSPLCWRWFFASSAGGRRRPVAGGVRCPLGHGVGRRR